MSATTFDTLAAARAAALVLACLVATGCATMESGSRIGTIDGVTPLHVARQGMAATEDSAAPYLEAIEILKAHGARSRVPFPFPRESQP